MSFSPGDVPLLPRGVRLRTDEIRGRTVLLAPERAFELDPNAAAILSLVDGARSVASIADALAARFEADRDEIERDVIEMLDDLAAKRVVDR